MEGGFRPCLLVPAHGESVVLAPLFFLSLVCFVYRVLCVCVSFLAEQPIRYIDCEGSPDQNIMHVDVIHAAKCGTQSCLVLVLATGYATCPRRIAVSLQPSAGRLVRQSRRRSAQR